MDSPLSFSPPVHSPATNENWEQTTSAASENTEVDVPLLWTRPPVRLHPHTGFKVTLILWFGFDESSVSFVALLECHSRAQMQNRLRGMYAGFLAVKNVRLMQITNNSKQSFGVELRLLFCFKASRKDLCGVFVIRRYYGTKWIYDFGYIRSSQAFDSIATCIFFFLNEIVIRCFFFLEEKSLWCTVKCLYHSQGKRNDQCCNVIFCFYVLEWHWMTDFFPLSCSPAFHIWTGKSCIRYLSNFTLIKSREYNVQNVL